MHPCSCPWRNGAVSCHRVACVLARSGNGPAVHSIQTGRAPAMHTGMQRDASGDCGTRTPQGGWDLRLVNIPNMYQVQAAPRWHDGHPMLAGGNHGGTAVRQQQELCGCQLAGCVYWVHVPTHAASAGMNAASSVMDG
jgi:hypothetical protein